MLQKYNGGGQSGDSGQRHLYVRLLPPAQGSAEWSGEGRRRAGFKADFERATQTSATEGVEDSGTVAGFLPQGSVWVFEGQKEGEI